MGHGGNDQTACIVAGQIVAEGRSRDHHKCRILTKERKRTDKNKEFKRTQQQTTSKRLETFTEAR